MRLLNVRTLEFAEFYSDDIPRYVVASHRWGAGEASIKDIRKRRNTETAGYKKVLGFAEFIRDRIHGVDWLWVDTCCLDQKSSQEVSEAVNAMFAWYSKAECCLAYLSDVTSTATLARSTWFKRGWTLQELLASRTVLFLSRDWQVLGHKGKAKGGDNALSLDLNLFQWPIASVIASITRIPEEVLHDYENSRYLAPSIKMSWVTGRQTTRPEDQAYCLFGIFDVCMPILYGEGRERALERLSKAMGEEHSPSQYPDITSRTKRKPLASPRPIMNKADEPRLVRRVRERISGAGLTAMDSPEQDRSSTPHKFQPANAVVGENSPNAWAPDASESHYGDADSDHLASAHPDPPPLPYVVSAPEVPRTAFPANSPGVKKLSDAPVELQLKGYILEKAEPLPGHRTSWARVEMRVMPFDEAKLQRITEKHRNRTETGPAGDLAALTSNQQGTIDRLIIEHKSKETDQNACWILYDVQRFGTWHWTTLEIKKIQVILKRQIKAASNATRSEFVGFIELPGPLPTGSGNELRKRTGKSTQPLSPPDLLVEQRVSARRPARSPSPRRRRPPQSARRINRLENAVETSSDFRESQFEGDYAFGPPPSRSSVEGGWELLPKEGGFAPEEGFERRPGGRRYRIERRYREDLDGTLLQP